MPITTFTCNRVDLQVKTPEADSSGGDVGEFATVLTNLHCSMQGAGFGTYNKWAAQNKVVGIFNCYFKGNLVWYNADDPDHLNPQRISVNDVTQMKEYRFLWNDAQSGGPVLLRMLGWGEATLGRKQVWKAELEQVA